MTPEEIGADIYRKYAESAYVTKEHAKMWLENAKKQVANEVEYGFYKEENRHKVNSQTSSYGTDKR